LTPSQALVVGLEVCRALDYAHKRGMSHHDLRPSSILFGEDRKVRVADFEGLFGDCRNGLGR